MNNDIGHSRDQIQRQSIYRHPRPDHTGRRSPPSTPCAAKPERPSPMSAATTNNRLHLPAVFALGLLIMLAAASPALAQALNLRYGLAPDRVSFTDSGWFPDNARGHATDHEDHFDFSRIHIGLTRNFIRSYLFNSDAYPGMRSPGSITFRLRRLGDSSKIILQANGQGVTTYLQKDPANDRYEITGLVNKTPIYWGSRAELLKWHDFTLQYDGQKRFLIIDHDPKQRYELKQSPTPHKDHLSLGMGYEYGKDMYIDVESIRFTPQGENEPALTKSPRHEGDYLAKDEQGQKRLAANFTNQKLQGPFNRWYPDGKLMAQGQYNQDQRDGTWTWYYPDGQERLRIQYNNGTLQGQYIRYYPTGQLESNIQYDNGQANGVFIRRFPNGDPKLIGGYKHNIMHGSWISWNDNHTRQWAHMSADGAKDVYLKTWYPDGTLKIYAGYKNDQPHGQYTDYHTNGQIKSQGHFNQGQRIGTWTTYDKQGKTLSTRDYDAPKQ